MRYRILYFIALFIACPVIVNAQQKDSIKKWYNLLPACPCKDPDLNGVKLNDGWAKDKGNLHKYHRGAKSSYRSYPATCTSEGKSSQQCCYDQNGDLITSGRAAGTPDKNSACKGENKNGFMTTRLFGLIGHYWKDVRPWVKLMKADSINGWATYNQQWPPDKGLRCKLNEVSR